MDYFVRFIGIVLIVTGGTTPNVPSNTAFIPMYYTPLCKSVIPKHVAFIRVPDMPKPDGSGWPSKDQRSCALQSPGTKEQCTIFFIPEESVITINSGFTPVGRSKPGSTFYKLGHIGIEQHDVNMALVTNPFNMANVSFVLPAGDIDTNIFANNMLATTIHVVAPSGSTKAPIVITAVGKAMTRVLKLVAGTTIDICDLPPTEAGVNFNSMSGHPGHFEHYLLYNALLDARHPACNPPNLDPLCSNQGCCP